MWRLKEKVVLTNKAETLNELPEARTSHCYLRMLKVKKREA